MTTKERFYVLELATRLYECGKFTSFWQLVEDIENYIVFSEKYTPDNFDDLPF